MGLAALFATCQVYFRDTSSFLPYFLRLWMYLSPVLWMPEMLSQDGPRPAVAGRAQPDVPDATGYANLLQGQAYPPLWMWIAAAAWAIGTVIVGFLFFISREREFAVRLT